ncbi:MAG: ATP-binding protein [Verrucomicrobiae bacterium]|nr:ATP-binding protein [Verrucomicrobiae bacterium]
MVQRPFWTQRMEQAWKQAPIVWLSGVRRVGKTTLAQAFSKARYLNCDLPSAQTLLHDPEAFYRSVSEPMLIFDEVHQLPDPSRVLKIGADEFPRLKILATGSSTLAATHKFRDSLTGRKRAVHLVPVLFTELSAFGIADVNRRLFHGGLPSALLSAKPDASFYSEWLDSYFARDVQELFRVEKRSGFLLLVETLLRQNGGLLEVSHLADVCRLSRATIGNYLDVLQVTHLVHLLRPFHGGGKQELVRQQKLYGFDTGFVAHALGWGELRVEDCGRLWENLVLDHLLAQPGAPVVRYWRDKQQREIDFVVPQNREACDAIECKWSPERFDPGNLNVFREIYPQGRNYVVSPHVVEAYTREVEGMKVTFTGLSGLSY